MRPDTGCRLLETAGPRHPPPDRGDQRPQQADNRSDPCENSGPARRARRRPDTAAALRISAGDNPERLGSEASFAALCGTSPVEASSGKTQRRRLNRGGDRQANAALYRIVLSRLCWAGPSHDYLRRRLAEGKTKREIIHCLKRYVARETYRHIVPANTTAQPTKPAQDSA
ncbi:transposase [Streptomyces sp. NPDC008137]|uniref:transposase n=1 Tax=Streptomyces sp. NPDC008137 TaxID=3364813 RepID=UPI0036EC6199